MGEIGSVNLASASALAANIVSTERGGEGDGCGGQNSVDEEGSRGWNDGEPRVGEEVA